MTQDFRTILAVTPSQWKIDHSDQILTLGSCFSDEIGRVLSTHKFETMVNPFGTVYNPVSIVRLLDWAISNESPKDGYTLSGESWVNFHFHSEFMALDRTQIEEKINQRMEEVHQFLGKAQYLVITLGTSWVYRYLKSDELVANCHKIPNNEFRKELLNPREVIRPLEDCLKRLREFNPGLKIILTVSPVRHLKDGIPENQVSKSILRIACHYLEEDLNFVEYFPSYEITLDDLRDYRFYQRDMIHPSSEAVEYIWQSFSKRYFTDSTQALNQEVESAISALDHRPFQPDSAAYHKFLKQTLKKLRSLGEKLNFDKEISELENKIDHTEK